jgi:hypothetical protein
MAEHLRLQRPNPPFKEPVVRLDTNKPPDTCGNRGCGLHITNIT